MSSEIKSLARIYADGSISHSQLLRLETILNGDAAARQQYLQELNLIGVLEDLSLDADSQATKLDDGKTVLARTVERRLPRFSLRLVLAVLAASVLLVGGLGWLTLGEKTIGSLTDLHGSVRWIGNDGMVMDDPVVGTQLRGGTLELLSVDTWAAFRFHDGSVVTLSGESESVISESDRKQLHLRRGNLSADITPQPAGYPMVVFTPAAELEVLGTQFNVAARPTSTVLAVNEGSVRLKRSSDGAEADVPAAHRVVASLDPTAKFEVNPREAEANTWQSRLENDVLHGDWKPASHQLAMKLKEAVASKMITEGYAIAEYKRAATLADQGTVWARPSEIGCFVWLNVSTQTGANVLVTDRTRIRVTGTLLAPSLLEAKGLEFGISTYTVGGGFVGKYSRSYSTEVMKINGSGAFEFVIDVADLAAKSSDSPVGLSIHDWWGSTKRNDAKLEIVQVEIFEQ